MKKKMLVSCGAKFILDYKQKLETLANFIAVLYYF